MGYLKFQVWNFENIFAKKIIVIWEETDGIVCYDNDKLPFDELGPNKSFDVSILLFGDAPSKLYVTTEWEKESG